MRNNPLIYLFRKTWHYSAGNRPVVIKYWTMFIVANALTLIFGPLIAAKIIDIVQKQGITERNINLLFLLLALPFLLDLVFWMIHGRGRVIERQNSFLVGTNYRKFLLSGVMMLPMQWHTDHHTGDTINKVENGAWAMTDFSEEGYAPIASLVELIVSWGMLIYFSAPAGLIVFVMIVVTAWVVIRFDRVMMSQYDELNRMGNHVSESVIDAITNITTIVILRVERLVIQSIANQIDKPKALYWKNICLNEWKWFSVNMCCTFTAGVITAIYFRQHIGTGPGVLAGDVFLLWYYLGKISGLFNRFAEKYSQTVKQKSRVVNAEELAKEFKNKELPTRGLPEQWRRLCIEDVNCSYHTNEGADLHLEHISLCVNRGERIAFIGTTGSGKSTLLKLMLALYPLRAVRLTVDGEVIPGGFAGISSITALVPQKPELLAKTIVGNLTMGAEYGMAIIRHYTDMACVTEVIEALPRKFESMVKKKGVNLSEGQQQRLALARGLLACHDKEIVLLDEPTSSLDIVNEVKVYENLFRGFRDKTIISSIHKLHLLPMFDRIYLFENGTITASGTLAELLAESSQFRDLWLKYHEHQKRVNDPQG